MNAMWRLLEVIYMQNAAINLFIPVLQVCTAVIRYYLPWFSIPPWLFICESKPTPLTPPAHTAHTAHSCITALWCLISFQLVPNTQRGLRCWPVQWASLPAHDPHDSMTYEIACFLDDSTSSIQVLDIWHFMTFRAWSLIEVHSTLDTSLFPTPWFSKTQNKIK